MMGKWIKRGVITVVAIGLVGGLMFGGNVIRYAKTCFYWTQDSVRQLAPVELDLRVAKQMVEEIMPEIHRNIRTIAQEEVEIAALKADLERSQKAFEEERNRIKTLRACLATPKAQYTFGGRDYTHKELAQDLAWRFERFKEAEIVLASKQKMLRSRQNALAASMQALERARMQKRLLADKIAALEARHRLIKANAIGSGVQIDNSKIAQTEKLIEDIRKRLAVAEKVLAYESHFVQTVPVDAVDEAELLRQIDEHLDGGAPASGRGSEQTAGQEPVAGDTVAVAR